MYASLLVPKHAARALPQTSPKPLFKSSPNCVVVDNFQSKSLLLIAKWLPLAMVQL